MLAGLALVVGLTQVPLSGAGFSGTTANPGSHLEADVIAPPTALSSAQRCVPLTLSVVGTSTGDISGGTVPLTIPAAVATGDLLIAQIFNDNSSSPPTGWAQLSLISSGGGNAQSALYQRVATAGDAGTTASFPVGGTKAGGGLIAVRNATGLVPGTHVAGLDNDKTVTIVAPSVTTTKANSFLISFFGTIAAGGGFTTPTGMTEDYDFGGSKASVAADHELRASTGATGTRTSTASSTALAIAFSVAVTPKSIPVVDLTWTPTISTYATGHEITRNTVVVTTVSPRTTGAWTDNVPGLGSTTYTASAAVGNWRSTTATTNLTVTACP